ncbi:MAG: hypothetical protein RBR47_10710 [Bacteroidales bacterium]|jgi:hypothetical protein|nr:hypothetical protein [Bacteroidales bacterium]NCU36280.1 hypothetical protein [Candidatus Falkowbacteria bacterium]MDD2631817.1 hypothetical protein [Bacteroidales bacterium]MDD3132587.1 hypothetical protein [Bacteroidales bacterium]MDD4741480.1 hypothetical protein [Bacteroidales bacterium]
MADPSPGILCGFAFQLQNHINDLTIESHRRGVFLAAWRRRQGEILKLVFHGKLIMQLLDH